MRYHRQMQARSLLLFMLVGACTGARSPTDATQEQPAARDPTPMVENPPPPTIEPPTIEPPTIEPPTTAEPTIAEPTIAVPTTTTGAPLVVEARNGFVQVRNTDDGKAGHLRFSSPPGGGCMVDIRWWRPMPPDPGGPMVVESRRPITIDGTKTDVVTTSMFEGAQEKVDVAFLSGTDYQIRIVFEGCGHAEQDAFLAGIRVSG